MTTKYCWVDDINNYMTPNERLNFLGDLGWELVSTTSVAKHWSERVAGNTTQIHLFLKHQKIPQ